MQDLTEVYPLLLDEEHVTSFDLSDSFTVQNPDSPMSEFDVAVSLFQSQGNISAAARSLGRSRRTVHTFILRSPLLSDWQEDIEAEFLDTVEQTYRNTALGGDDTACRFFLTTKGKSRGYVSRAETTGANGTPLLPATIDATKLSDKELEELNSLLTKAN